MATQHHDIFKNFSVFVDGRGYAGRAPEVTPPKLALKTDEFRAGGMDVPVEVEMGLEKLELDFTLRDFSAENLALWGLGNGKDVPVVLRGAAQDSGTGAVKAVVITAKGMVREMDPGSWKSGEAAVNKYTMALNYYKLTVDGQEVHEIDAVNMVRKINGEDRMAETRTALGI